jgi:nitrogen fixation protein NifX
MSARALRLIEDETAPPLVGPALRIAIATQDRKGLNAHFGSAKQFVMYDVTATDARFVGLAAFDDVSDESGKHKNEGDDRITPKVEALTGCHLLFCLAIGGPSAAKVVSAKIHPVKVSAPEPIEGVIGRVQGLLAGNPPPWLRKILAANEPREMSFLDEED